MTSAERKYVKAIEKLAITAIILSILAQLVSRVANHVYFALANTGWSKLHVILLTIPTLTVSLALNIVIAVWLYRISKREQMVPWVWAAVGVFFGVTGAILFFAFRLYEMAKENTANTPSDRTR